MILIIYLIFLCFEIAYLEAVEIIICKGILHKGNMFMCYLFAFCLENALEFDGSFENSRMLIKVWQVMADFKRENIKGDLRGGSLDDIIFI